MLLLQDIIRAPLNKDVEIVVRQANRANMRETLKEVEKKGIRRIIGHLNIQDTYNLLKAVSTQGNDSVQDKEYLESVLLSRKNKIRKKSSLSIHPFFLSVLEFTAIYLLLECKNHFCSLKNVTSFSSLIFLQFIAQHNEIFFIIYGDAALYYLPFKSALYNLILGRLMNNMACKGNLAKLHSVYKQYQILALDE